VTKVLVLSSHPQMDRRITAEANVLLESGRSVTLACRPVCLAGTGLDPRVRVCMAQGNGPSGFRRTPGKWLQLGQTVLPYPLYRLAFWGWQGLRRRDRFYRKYFFQHIPAGPFDVIHCHDLDVLPTAVAWRKERLAGARLIYDAHELSAFASPVRNQQRYWGDLERSVIHEVDAVITVNESVAVKMQQMYGIAMPDVLLNSCGVTASDKAIDRAAFLAHFGAADDGFKVLFMGFLLPGRNLECLADAFALLPDTHKLFLLGMGPEKASLQDRCVRRGQGNVFFGDWPAQDSVLAFAAHADLGIIPYREDGVLNNRYCTPNKLFEFIEAQVPICASDLPELRRFVRDQGIGEVYRMESAQAIAAAVEDCRQRCQRGEFSASARQEAREKSSWSKQAQKLLGIYERLGV